MDRAAQIDAGISKVEDGINQVNTEGICDGYTRVCLDIDSAWPASTQTHTYTRTGAWVSPHTPHAVRNVLLKLVWGILCGALKALRPIPIGSFLQAEAPG